MYRTEDNYIFAITDKILDIKEKYEVIKKNDLDYEYSFEAITELFKGGGMICYNTHKEYKKFVFLLYTMVGPLKLEISFSPEESEFGCEQSTEINFEVDDEGSAKFDLKNIIEPQTGDEESEEYINYKNILNKGFVMFENDKSVEFKCNNLDLKQFLEKLN